MFYEVKQIEGAVIEEGGAFQIHDENGKTFGSYDTAEDARDIAQFLNRRDAEKSLSEAEKAQRAVQGAENVLRADYFEDVRSCAKDIRDEMISEFKGGKKGEELREWLIEHAHETIDGHSRVIYTASAVQCLLFSNNDGRYFDEFGEDGAVKDGSINWSAIAFSAFEADVMESLERNFGVDPNEPDADLHTYEVVVGNIGTVYDGMDEDEARKHYDEYVEQSKSGVGRAGNEPVTLLVDGDEEDEYTPETEEDDDDEPENDDGGVEDIERQNDHE